MVAVAVGVAVVVVVAVAVVVGVAVVVAVAVVVGVAGRSEMSPSEAHLASILTALGHAVEGGCRCDSCEACGRPIRPARPVGHRAWCPTPEWVPAHHGGEHRREEEK